MRATLIGFILAASAFAQSKVVVNPFPPGSGLELVPPGAAGPAGPQGPVGPAGSSGGAGFQPSQPLSGCGVEYVSGLTYTAGACTYTINGQTFSAPLTNLTLTTADPSNPRIDVIGVDTTGSWFVLTGTPAGTPAAPTVDASTQLQITFAVVAAGATTPSNVSATAIYLENTEWTCTASAHFNCASTNNPYTGTKDIEATTAVSGNNVTLVKPAAGTVNLSNFNTLIFYIRSKGQWPTGNGTGANGLRTLSVFWLNGSTQVGTQVVIRDGQFGFSSSVTGSYQQVAIPVGAFATASNLATTLKFQISGNGGTSNIGFYLDQVTLQAGTPVPVLPSTLMNWKGTWNSTSSYNVNDVVVSGGIGYVALVQNTNVAVGTAATWASLAGSGGTCAGLGGDLSGTCAAATVAKVDGVTYPASPSTHQTPVVTAANTVTYKTLPDCQDTGGNHLNYTQSTDAYSCGTSGSAASNYSQSFTSQTSVTLTHNLNTTNINVQCFDNSSPPLYIGVNSIALTDANDATVTFTNSQSGKCIVVAGSGSPVTNPTLVHGLQFSIGAPGGSALTTSSVSATLTVPFACSIGAYNLAFGSGDSGTITVKFWKVATGTAIPTSGNSINTSGVGISTGTAIHSTTLSDFTTTSIAANDMMAMAVTAVSGSPASITGVLQCQ